MSEVQHGENPDFGTEAEAPVLVLYGVDKDGEGEIEMEFDSGSGYSGECLFLSCKVLDVAEGGAKRELMLIVPTSVGPALLSSLLTPDQWEAVLYASD